MVQMVYNKTPVDVLQRYGCNTDSILQCGMNINNFYDRGYSLEHVNALIPEYSQMVRLGINVGHFTGANSWSIVTFSNLYRVQLKTLLRGPSGFNLTPKQLVQTRLKSVHLFDANFTARELIEKKADFAFWFQLGCTPDEFHKQLKGGLNEIADMNLSEEQKKAMKSTGWTRDSLLLAIEGMSKETANRLWPVG